LEHNWPGVREPFYYGDVGAKNKIKAPPAPFLFKKAGPITKGTLIYNQKLKLRSTQLSATLTKHLDGLGLAQCRIFVNQADTHG
jgi:hypothetical protein